MGAGKLFNMTRHFESAKRSYMSSTKIAFKSKQFQKVSKPSLKPLGAVPTMTSDLILEKFAILICATTSQKMGPNRDMLGLSIIMRLMMRVTISKLLILFWMLLVFS